MKEKSESFRGPLIFVILLTLLPFANACSNNEEDRQHQETPYSWSRIIDSPDAALLSVHGTSSTNVYAVGADSGDGPLALHWNGRDWTKLETGLEGDLWWVHGAPLGALLTPLRAILAML